MLRILLIVLALIYILSPYDLLPDIFPVAGWLDDAFLLGVLLYYLRFRRLPGFLSGFMRSGPGGNASAGRSGNSDSRAGGNGPQAAAADPYEVLGIRRGAGPEEIRSAYRKAAQAYHPDKVAHLGPELRELAQRKFIEIQKAYAALTGRPR